MCVALSTYIAERYVALPIPHDQVWVLCASTQVALIGQLWLNFVLLKDDSGTRYIMYDPVHYRESTWQDYS